MDPTPAYVLVPRQSQPPSVSGGNSTGDAFVDLIASPFANQFSTKSLASAIGFSLILTAVIALGFCFIRPYNNVVYAPRAKHADSKHAPPTVDKGLFGWVRTLIRTKEPDLIEKLGMDAAVFLRFTRMMRWTFLALTVVGCGILIPLDLVNGYGGGFLSLTPLYLYGSSLWGYVVVAYLFDVIIFYFLWSNYRAIVRMRRSYFDSTEYQRSLHARTLLLTDIPAKMRTDDGIVRITEQVKATGDTPRAAIGRNVRDLPDLVEEHEDAVRTLEKVLAKYLSNPNSLPATRPKCKASKNGKAYSKGQEVDAIDYLTSRIRELEIEIKEVRMSIDSRNALPYGFATYENITEAHSVAHVSKKKGPQGTIIQMAPKPQNLMWKNLPMLKKQRDWNNFINNLWVALLTVAWIVPNVLLAVFVSNLHNLALVWPGFQTSLYAHPTWWALVQGIVAPAISTAFYYYLPAIFRRLTTNAGDVTRTGRERHVMHKLFSFFVVNNLVVFSLFGAVAGFIATIINANNGGQATWEAIQEHNPFEQIINTLITITPYWCSYLLQRNLGAAVDLAQLFRLLWGTFSRRYLNPTPRELIELTAPQPFEYAAYYNYFLFYTAAALCFGSLNPLALAITALYFWIDSFAKKYMLLYIFITKYESGGLFWRSLFNRVLISTALANLVVACLVATKGDPWIGMLASMAPLIFLILGFKWYCARAFDDSIYFYSKGQTLQDDEIRARGEGKSRKGDRVGVRFGHPALFKPLMTPMVAAKSQHLLKQVYTGRTSVDESSRVAGYSDVYMDAMDSSKPGKPSAGNAPFEIVNENEMDYEHWKDRPEFRDEAGGDGELFGSAPDYIRPGTPSSMMSGPTRAGTFESSPRSRSQSRDNLYNRDRSDSDTTRVNDDAGGVEYPKGYHATPTLGEQSPARNPAPPIARRPISGDWTQAQQIPRRPISGDWTQQPGQQAPRRPISNQHSREGLVQGAARMGQSPPPQLSRPVPQTGYGPIRMGMGVGTPGAETPASSEGMTPYTDEETSYDYFRPFRRGRGL